MEAAVELNDIAIRTEEHREGFDHAMTLHSELIDLKITVKVLQDEIAEKELELARINQANRRMDEGLFNTKCFNIKKSHTNQRLKTLSANG